VLRRPALCGGREREVVTIRHALLRLHPQAGLRRRDEGLHAAERGVGLPPHQLPADQRLQLHEAAQRAQRLPRLRCVTRQGEM
jgi:hypothetical protein